MSFCSPPTLGTHNSHQTFSFVRISEYQASLVFYLVVALTGGRGVFTWQAHGEFIVSSETIRPLITHQAHGGYFLKEFINSPTYYPPGTWWVLFKSAYDSTQWKRHGQNIIHSPISSPQNLSICFEFFHKIPTNVITMYPGGSFQKTHQELTFYPEIE